MAEIDLFSAEGLRGEDTIADAIQKIQPWEERFRGHNLDEIILPEKVDKMFRTAFKLNTFSNYILYSGTPGTGKTSLAKAIPEMLGSDYLFLYGKNEAEILAEIEEYSKYSSPNGMPRFVVIDEADKARDPERFYKNMQSLIDQAASTLCFILTCNDFFRIPAAVKSRCECIEFTVPTVDDEDYKKRLFKRLMHIAREVTKPVGGTVDKNTVANIMYSRFPDVRTMIGLMRRTFLDNEGSIIGNPGTIRASSVEELFDTMMKFDPAALLHYISSEIAFCPAVYTPLSWFIVDQKLPPDAIMQIGIILAREQDRSLRQVDQELALWGTCLEIMQAIKKYAPEWKWVRKCSTVQNSLKTE